MLIRMRGVFPTSGVILPDVFGVGAVLGVAVACLGGGCASPGVDPSAARVGIARTLDEWHAAAAAGDGNTYFGLMTPDAVFLGTDATERWPGPAFRAFAEPYFDGVEAWTYVPTERWVETGTSGAGVVWFDEVLSNAKYGTSRGTGIAVFDRASGRWKVAAYGLSFPIPNELAGGVTAEIKAYEADQVNEEDDR